MRPEARLKDLTSTGAGIVCEEPLKRGTDVVLNRGDLFIAARVAWCEGRRAGVEFYRPLPAMGTLFDLGG